MKHTAPLYPDQYFHLYNHAVGRENFFNSDDNYLYFLNKYSQYIYPICQTYAYCLMPNHFHFLVRVRSEDVLFDHAQALYPDKELVQANFSYPRFAMQQFSNFFNGYTKAYNKMYQRRGALFIDYLRRKRVENERYFLKLIHYIHYNPVHHQFCQLPSEWPYSSYQAVLVNVIKLRDCIFPSLEGGARGAWNPGSSARWVSITNLDFRPESHPLLNPPPQGGGGLC